MELTEIAKSKINLSLNLSGKKNKGFHDHQPFTLKFEIEEEEIRKRLENPKPFPKQSNIPKQI